MSIASPAAAQAASARPLHRCMVKATTEEGEAIRYSPNWVVARRGIMKVYGDRLECGDWCIPYEEMDEAVLFGIRQWFIPGYLLRIRSGGRIYQFGLNWGRFWKGPLPFPVRRERARIGYSAYSIAVRVLLLAALAYYLWQR